jgi:hypothetical protein
MIAASIADNTGAALTAGIVTAVAVLCLIVATAVTTPLVSSGARDAATDAGPADVVAAEVEASIETLVARGGDEEALRALAGKAVRLGQLRRVR